MAILRVCALYDRALFAYGTPFFSRSLPQAVRGFEDAVRAKGGRSDLSEHPEDFDLYYIANWDDEDGSFTPRPSGMELIKRGKDVLRIEPHSLATETVDDVPAS